MPQIGNNFIINVKDTSVMFIIGFPDFFAAHRAAVGASYLYFPSATVEMAGYLCMTLIASFLLRWVEKRLDGSSNYELVQEDPLTMTAGTYNHPDLGGYKFRRSWSAGLPAPAHSCCCRPAASPPTAAGRRQ